MFGDNNMLGYNKWISKVLTTAAILVAFLLITACQTNRYDHESKTLLEQNWGRSFEAAKYNQTLNPDAPEHLDPPTGMDGAAAESSLERYREGFKKEAADTNVIIIPN